MNMKEISLFVLVIFLTCVFVTTKATCPAGWFGSNCQYMCHCDSSSTCRENGQCPTKCARGWFGQGCQYEDLATLPEVTIKTWLVDAPSWLTDGDDATCNDGVTDVSDVTISWKLKQHTPSNIQNPSIDDNTMYDSHSDPDSLNFHDSEYDYFWESTSESTSDISYPITWIRFKVDNANLRSSFSVIYKTSMGLSIDCDAKEIFYLDDETVDYRCNPGDSIHEITITGAGLKSLCSLYVSGGRNFALKQSAYQSTTYSNFSASVAVDGNTNSTFSNGTCTHTEDEDPSPSWTLTLDTAKVVNRFVLYNRDFSDGVSERLKKFKLEILDMNNTVLWTHKDEKETMMVYTVTRLHKEPVSKIRITATSTTSPNDTLLILTLCEVMAFGECVRGTWDMDCDQICPKDCSTSCHQETGICGSCVSSSIVHEPESRPMSFGAGVGVGFLVCSLLVVAVGVVVMVILHRRKSIQSQQDAELRPSYNYKRLGQ